MSMFVITEGLPADNRTTATSASPKPPVWPAPGIYDTAKAILDWMLALIMLILAAPLILVAISGGGSRAAALGWVILREVAKFRYSTDGQTRGLIDDIGVVSSVSGGSVIAAHFARAGQPNGRGPQPPQGRCLLLEGAAPGSG